MTERAAEPFADHDVVLEVFHRRVENFLDDPDRRWIFNEQHVVRLEVGQAWRPDRRAFENRADVWRRSTHFAAMMCARVALPSPGGPNSST